MVVAMGQILADPDVVEVATVQRVDHREPGQDVEANVLRELSRLKAMFGATHSLSEVMSGQMESEEETGGITLTTERMVISKSLTVEEIISDPWIP